MRNRLSKIEPLTAVAIPIAIAPFGYLVGFLLTVHVVSSEAEAVWLSTVALTSLALLLIAARE